MANRTLRPMNLKQRAIVARRVVFRHAFDLIRGNPEKKKLVDQFAGCLGTSIHPSCKLYRDLYQLAQEMCEVDGRHVLVTDAQTADDSAKSLSRVQERRRHSRATKRIAHTAAIHSTKGELHEDADREA